MGWAGWGAGPSGAGASGGPSRWFLAVALVGCAVCTVIMAVTQNWVGAAVGGLVSIWFFSRLFLGVGAPPPEDRTPPAPRDPPASPADRDPPAP